LLGCFAQGSEKERFNKERERATQAMPLLPSFVLRRLNLWNPIRGNENLQRIFLMLRSKRLQVLLS
jgi:hypothetical protein